MIQISEKKLSQVPRFLMVLSVPLILFIFLLLGYTNTIPLKVEMHSIIIIFLILVIFMSFISHNAWYSYASFKNSTHTLVEEIETHLINNNLILAGKQKALGNVKPFLENHVRNIRNDNFANVAASIFPTLGILGTFTAIAISMPNFTVESKEALESEITILLSGVGTAFYASIYGIFLSIWWVFFEKRGLTKIQIDLDEMKTYYKELVWDKDEIELYRILENQEQNKRFLEKIENVVTPEYLFNLDSIAKAKLEHLEKLDAEYKVNEERLSKNYNDLMKVFEETSIRQENMLGKFEEMQVSVEKVSESYSNNIEEQQKSSKAVKSEIYSVLSSFELVSSDLKALGKDLINGK